MPHPLTSGTWRCLLNARESVGYVPIANPLEVPGVVQWWSSKAVADAGGEGYVDGNSVETLLDYSGNGNTFTNAAAAERGIWKNNIANGYGAIRMDNSNDGYVGTWDVGAAGASTIMLLMSPRVNDTAGHSILNSGTNIWTFLGADRGHVLYDGTQNYDCYNKRDASDRGVPVGFALTQTSGKVQVMWVQGAKGHAVTMATQPRVIHLGNEGADHNWPGPDCDLIELVMWNRVLDDSEIQDVFIYWRNTYAIKSLYWEDFDNPDGATDVAGTLCGRGSFEQMEDGTEWASTWVYTPSRCLTQVEDFESKAAGNSLNGMSTGIGTIVARGSTVNITSRTYQGNPDLRANLNAGTIVIPFSFGSDWDSLTIALLYAGSSGGSNPAATKRIALGVCSGSTNIPGDANVDHFVGCTNNTVDGWTKVGTSPDYYFHFARAGVCVDNSWSYSASTIGVAYVDADPANYRNGYSVHISKGSPNFSINHYSLQFLYADYPASAFENFYTEFEGGHWGVQNLWVPYAHSPRTPRTIAVDEANNGALDHLCFWWGPTEFNFEISAIMVHRTIW